MVKLYRHHQQKQVIRWFVKIYRIIVKKAIYYFVIWQLLTKTRKIFYGRDRSMHWKSELFLRNRFIFCWNVSRICKISLSLLVNGSRSSLSCSSDRLIFNMSFMFNPFTPGRAIWPNDKHWKRWFCRGLSTKYCKCSDGSFLIVYAFT